MSSVMLEVDREHPPRAGGDVPLFRGLVLRFRRRDNQVPDNQPPSEGRDLNPKREVPKSEVRNLRQ
jgi:hypothetical protein